MVIKSKSFEKASFKFNFTIVFSALAFILSLINFYYSNWYVEDHMQARFVGFDSMPSSDSPDVDDYYVKFVIINLGNRPGVIMNVSYDLTSNHEKVHGYALNTPIANDSIPFVLQPRQMKIISFRIPTL